jgi:hypothetical protein
LTKSLQLIFDLDEIRSVSVVNQDRSTTRRGSRAGSRSDRFKLKEKKGLSIAPPGALDRGDRLRLGVASRPRRGIEMPHPSTAWIEWAGPSPSQYQIRSLDEGRSDRSCSKPIEGVITKKNKKDQSPPPPREPRPRQRPPPR